ncbi:MAG: hypothetical protein AB7N91_25875 [Candidatus Tectimicrobiota bacterium]
MWKQGLAYLRPRGIGCPALLLLLLLSGTAATGVTDHPEDLAHQLITATTLATAQLEYLKTLDYRRLRAASGTTTEDYYTLPDFPTYRRQTTVTVQTPEPGLTQISVAVYWQHDAQAIHLSTLVAE